MASKGKKMQMGFCAAAKYALHSDTYSPAVAFRKAGKLSTNHQCGAHVLRREDLHFSGLQPCQRTTGTPLYRPEIARGACMPKDAKLCRVG